MKKIILSFLIIYIMLSASVTINAMTYYEELDFVTGLVTANALNVRTGPGTNFKPIGLVYKNEYVRVFAKVGEWYVIQTENDLIGAVSAKYIKKITPDTSGSSANKKEESKEFNNTTSYSATKEEQELLELINEQRIAYGLPTLKFDAQLQNVAKIKANDLVLNGYFSHNSPKYGSPFDMMKSFGITYKSAGENIAGNSTLKGAVTAWMNSQGHRDNILSSSYNYTGIGIVDSPIYGKIMVQMFIGK